MSQTTTMTLPTCPAGEYIRGDMTCASLPVSPAQFCMNLHIYNIAELVVIVLFCGVMAGIAIWAANRVIRKRHPSGVHDECRRVHPLNEPCQFTDEQKRLMAKHGNPAVFEHAIMDAIGEISIGEAKDAIARYRHRWDAAGE